MAWTLDKVVGIKKLNSFKRKDSFEINCIITALKNEFTFFFDRQPSKKTFLNKKFNKI